MITIRVKYSIYLDDEDEDLDLVNLLRPLERDLVLVLLLLRGLLRLGGDLLRGGDRLRCGGGRLYGGERGRS